ncbi:glycine N-phenylacetyltransferase-like [Ochotona curzoniae]|uniref:glycine N-phenylacetyltransferase-like n=1 Tax=Ochotona curzoniae TaxID=130825 RepID=UPI001B34EDEB|nr:glycine N-phenylacetyltransferase-like [Ochotona curzoniae]
MIHLQKPQLLQMLETSLRNSLPESLKAYGTIFHMYHGNPFNLKAVVDKWPDFSTVVACPQEQEMTDNFDHYTNTYLIYSKDLNKCQEFLATSDIINWKQHLQIQSTQGSLDEVIQNLAASKSVKVKRTECVLYMMPDTAKKLVPSLLETMNLPPQPVKSNAINQEMFKPSTMDVAHAPLVNKFWHFGGNERSQRFIERCIRTFPSLCLLGPDGSPVSWFLMDHTGELRMGATVPEYRNHGLISYLSFKQREALNKLGFPLYCHTDKSNKIVQKLGGTQGFVPMPCDWNQWNCVPLGSEL